MSRVEVYKGTPYILSSGNQVIASDSDLNDYIASSYEHETDRLLFRSDDFCEEFFDISSRVAGAVLQKLTNYRFRTAIVLDEGMQTSTLFSQMVSDTNRMGCIHFFFDCDKALQWLTENKSADV